MKTEDLPKLFALLSTVSKENRDAPDGAYYEMLYDVVRYWNVRKRTNYNEYDVVSDWSDQKKV